MDKILLFIPMYNCEKQIVRVLDQLHGEILNYINEVLVVNNRSTDNGEKVVSEYIEHSEKKVKMTLVRNNENYGLGGSHKVAFSYAIKNEFDYMIVLHGDDQGRIQDMLPLLQSGKYKNYDACLGGRFAPGSSLEGYSKFRTFGNRVFNIIFSFAIHQKVYDLGAGLNMYKVSMLKSNYYHKFSDNLAFNCYMLLAVDCYKQKICFFPISWREEDQRSNVKMTSQAIQTLKLAMKYIISGQKYLKSEFRQADRQIVEYKAEIIQQR